MTFENYDSVIIGTGNILENEEFKQAKTPTQEVRMELIKIIAKILKNYEIQFLFRCSSALNRKSKS